MRDNSAAKVALGAAVASGLGYTINQLPPIPDELPNRDAFTIGLVVIFTLLAILIAVWPSSSKAPKSISSPNLRSPNQYRIKNTPTRQSANPNKIAFKNPIRIRFSPSWKPLALLGLLHIFPTFSIAFIISSYPEGSMGNEGWLGFWAIFLGSTAIAALARGLVYQRNWVWVLYFLLSLIGAGGLACFWAFIISIINVFLWFILYFLRDTFNLFKEKYSSSSSSPWSLFKSFTWVWALALLLSGAGAWLFSGAWFVASTWADFAWRDEERQTIATSVASLLLSITFTGLGGTLGWGLTMIITGV